MTTMKMAKTFNKVTWNAPMRSMAVDEFARQLADLPNKDIFAAGPFGTTLNGTRAFAMLAEEDVTGFVAFLTEKGLEPEVVQ